MSKEAKKKEKNVNGNINDRIAHLITWFLWTLIFAFLLPVLLSLIKVLAGTVSFLDEMGSNYLAIILSQAASLLWIIINLRNNKSKEMSTLAGFLIGLLMMAIYFLCAAFFSPIADILLFPRLGEDINVWHRCILIFFSLTYLILLILSARHEWKTYIPTS